MSRKKIFKPFFSLLDLLFLMPILIFAIWIYLIPPFQTFGYHTLFSDDAIFAMLARKTIEEGPWGAFHLAWGPLLPWLNALSNIFFNVPLDEGPRIITGISLTLRVIPIYFLAKFLFNKTAAFVAIFLISIYTFLLIPAEATLAEGLYSLIVFTGFLFSYLALKTEKISWYFFSGAIWGLAYLARLEGWFFLIPFLILTTLRLTVREKNRFYTFKLLIVSIIGFIVISSPFLIFIKQSYDSFTLNPRANIVLVSPGNLFTLYNDLDRNTNQPITPAQIYFSGEQKYYSSSLWHPTPFMFWRAIGRSWSTLSIIPNIYLNFFREQFPIILFGGIIGLLLTILLVFRKNLNLLISLIAISGLIFAILDFSLTTIEFTSPILFNPNGTFILFIDQFYKMLNTAGYLNPLIRDLLIFIITFTYFIKKKENFLKLIKLFYSDRLRLYLPLTLFLGFIPLFFNSFASKYAIVTGTIFSLYTGFTIVLLYQLINKFIPKKYYLIPILIILSCFFWINRQQIYHTLDTREAQYKINDFKINYLKKPGLVILKDHGPGAKIGVFYEAPVFYAKGIPFYFAVDSNITLEQTVKYFEINKVDYFVLTIQSFYSWPHLKPLLLPTTKLQNWKMIYSDPPIGTKISITNTSSDVLVTVWKFIRTQ